MVITWLDAFANKHLDPNRIMLNSGTIWRRSSGHFMYCETWAGVSGGVSVEVDKRDELWRGLSALIREINQLKEVKTE